jgi:NAD-dependent dihydropyrimidine dehydrogenase PreA subunit
MRVLRKIIEIDDERCDGCGQCVPACAEGAIEIIDGKAKLVAEKYCDGLGACLGDCPTGALRVVEVEADEFDEDAVEDHLSKRAQRESTAEPIQLHHGCPSALVRTFGSPEPGTADATPSSHGEGASALTHWPVQIRLVPPTAPFLKDADLLVAADCTPVAYPNFHADFLDGRVVMVGCPKFDEAQAYVEKFADIFSKADIKSITVVVMEVPCCAGLPRIVEEGLRLAGKKVPMEKVVISAKGEVLNRERPAA